MLEDKFRETMFYRVMDEGVVQCETCFRRCVIKPDGRGFCRNNENRGGRLYNIVYARPAAINIDPIEKEPCYHMLPGTNILCFGTAGCNFRCRFCHNWHLSQRRQEEMDYVIAITPEQAVMLAKTNNIPTVSFTYNEPTSFYEFVYDISQLAKEKGLKVLWHSNGGINPAPLKALLKFTDAVTIDLKAFTEKFYREVSSSSLEPVLRTLEIIREEGKWLEIVNLVVPTLNDDPNDIRRMCKWLEASLGAYTPLHFSRFFPNYKLTNLPPTPIEKLEEAYEIAREAGLEYVSIGNVPGHKYNSTFCPNCNNVLIRRNHFMVLSINLDNGSCKFCRKEIPGIWQ